MRSTYHFSNPTISLLICTLISENHSLEKSRSISDPRKFSGSANPGLFSMSPPWKKDLGLYYKPEKNPGAKPEKSRVDATLYFFQVQTLNLRWHPQIYFLGCKLKGRVLKVTNLIICLAFKRLMPSSLSL